MRFQVVTPTGLVIRLQIEKIFFTDPQSGSKITRFRAKTTGLDCGGKTQAEAYDNAMARVFQKRRDDWLLMG